MTSRANVLNFVLVLAVAGGASHGGALPALPQSRATQVAVVAQPSATAHSGRPLIQQPVVRVRDALGIAVNRAGVVMTRPTAGRSNSIAVDTRGGSPQDQQFAPANILNNASFETGWDGFTNWSAGPIPTGVSRDSTQAADGRWSVRRSWVPNPAGDGGAQLLYHVGATDRVWLRFSLKITSGVSTVMKFMRWYDPQFNSSLGGFYLEQGSRLINFGTDAENGSIYTPIGVTADMAMDGHWHTLEMAYWRNGDASGFPCAAFWFDGREAAMPDDTPVKYTGAGNVSTWRGGELCSGQRATTKQIGYIEMLATLNGGNTTSGSIWIDRVSISTIGRIGP